MRLPARVFKKDGNSSTNALATFDDLEHGWRRLDTASNEFHNGQWVRKSHTAVVDGSMGGHEPSCKRTACTDRH